MKNKKWKVGDTEYGYGSKCVDGKHVLLLDYDDEKPEHIMMDLQGLQKQFKLHEIYLFKSRNGYNAICLDKFDLSDAFTIKMHSAYSDPKHNRIGFERGNWVLRIGEDKLYVTSVTQYINRDLDYYSNSPLIIGRSSIKRYKMSNAHRMVLNKIFDLYIPKVNGMYDDNTQTPIDMYIRKELVIDDA